MKGRMTLFISVLATMAVISSGCVSRDKVANDIRNATRTVDPYDYNNDFSDVKNKTGLGRGNANGYWGYDADGKRIENATDRTINRMENTAEKAKDQVRKTTNEVNDRLNTTPNPNATGRMVSPNTATDSQYNNPYLYGNSKSGDYIVNPVVLGT